MLDGQVTDVFNDTWWKRGLDDRDLRPIGRDRDRQLEGQLIQGGKKIGASRKLATDRAAEGGPARL